MITTWEGTTYTVSQICDYIKERGIIRSKGIEYYNAPIAFDTEGSSFYVGNEKMAVTYVWMFGAGGRIMFGRTWEEFVNLMNEVSNILWLNGKRRIIVYVHNLSYDFQFFAKWLVWDKIFALDKHKPLYCLSTLGIEFRCSYLLSGLSLEKIGDNLTKYKVQKQVGLLDYDKLRGNNTPLSDGEMSYCAYDIIVLNAYIQERIEEDGNIGKIPLTVTGYVRKYCKNRCLYVNGNTKYINKKYKRLMKDLTLEPEEYTQLKRTFQGGFVHANAYRSDRVHYNVSSADFTSSYPAVMVSELYPMSKGKKVKVKTVDELKYYLNYYCVMFEAHFFRISGKLPFENIISSSRCIVKGKRYIDNGRIQYADEIITFLTDVDFKSILQFYEWDNMKVSNVWIYERAYLPTELIEAVLFLYRDKTELKDVMGKEAEYMRGKGMLNSVYGCSVTDAVRDEIIYNNYVWGTCEVDLTKAIAKYNNSWNRFLFYPWGVWITAYARKNLFSGILELKSDYIYSDTDSVKYINREAHTKYFARYNKMIIKKLELAMNHHNLPMELCFPKTVKGEVKPLGVWDDEGTYKRFKTVGAKRYIVENNDKSVAKGKPVIEITVAGLGKKIAREYLISKYGIDGTFENFTTGLFVPKEHSGKLTHTYSPDGMEWEGDFIDYLGNKCHYHEKGWVHLEPQPYSMDMSMEYLQYLRGIVEIAN